MSEFTYGGTIDLHDDDQQEYLGRGTESLPTNDRAEAESGALSSGSDRDATQQQCGSSWGAMIGGGDSDCDEAADFLS